VSKVSRKDLLLTSLWGDSETLVVNPGTGAFRSRELFRVASPMPTTWRVMAQVSVDRPGDFGMVGSFILFIGTGRALFEVPISVPVNTWNNFVVPGLTFSGLFDMPAAPALPATFRFLAWIAPEVPWDGLKVECEFPNERSR